MMRHADGQASREGRERERERERDQIAPAIKGVVYRADTLVVKLYLPYLDLTRF